MLGRRAYPSAHVRERIAASFGAEQAESVVARLFELRVLDDRAYAERFARDRFERAGYGSERIRTDLLTRGLAPADVDSALAAVIDDARERERAEAALQRFCRVSGSAPSDPHRDPKLRDAAFRHLVGRGFPIDLVHELLQIE
jgi:SOS response regulatory protein OraA/RecX